jgi:hypothetical protein
MTRDYMRATIWRPHSGFRELSQCSGALLQFERSRLSPASKSQQLRSLQIGTRDAQCGGMNIARLYRYGDRHWLVGSNQSSGTPLRPDGTAEEEKLSYFRAPRSSYALSQRLARHEFGIQDLGQTGWLRPHRYRYFCIRCRWLFLIENRRGDATAVDESGRSLPEPAQSTRVATFASGPCPAAFPEIDVMCEKRGFYRAAKKRQQESATVASSLPRTLSAVLRTALTKRLSRIA